MASNMPKRLIYLRNGQVLEGTGVTPDVIVLHRESLLSKRDAALDAAVKWIESNRKGAT
jgi:C-terminal processing protease CtpA/Prc